MPLVFGHNRNQRKTKCINNKQDKLILKSKDMGAGKKPEETGPKGLKNPKVKHIKKAWEKYNKQIKIE